MKKGFGLIEVVISAGIFVIFIGSLTALSGVSARNSVINKHRLIAANLVREGLELVSEMRDTAWRQGKSWSDLGTSVCFGLVGDGGARYIQYTNPAGCNYYYWNLVTTYPGSPSFNSPRFYEGVGYVDYTRTFSVVDLDISLKKITVRVTWPDFGTDRYVEGITYLTNWKQ